MDRFIMTKKNIAPPKKSNRQKKTVKSKGKKFTFNTRVALGSQKTYQRNMPVTLSEAPWENQND